ncbi:MAG: hypothetical protein M3N38_08815, partial [Pseudomonadota bacterium]|nr:hypothetical protein [Pseudomonadota bacterium]
MPPAGVRNRPVESSDLAPVMAPDTSGLPLELWRGLEMADIERLLAGLDLPPRSPALHQVWRRMLLSSASPPAGAPSPDHFMALRLEALYRSGLLRDMAEVERGASPGPLARIVLARKDIGLGAREAGCATIKSLAVPGADLRGRLRGEAQLLTGYCAAIAGDGAAAGLAANLAREEGMADLALRVLDGFSMATKPHLGLPARVSLLDFRFLELMGPVSQTQVLEKAEPALLVALAGAPTSDLRMRTAAAEAALRLNAMPPDAVVDVYRLQPEPSARTTPNEAGDAVVRRARLFRAAEVTQAPELKARLLRALLDDARRAGIHVQTARMLAPLVGQLWPSFETGMLAEPVVEIAAAAGEHELARRWAETAATLQHWLALIALADPQPGRGRHSGLASVDDLAKKGRLSVDVLHRLATVLDALDVDVPMSIWEAAGRTPQPASGYLPETGVLADLAQSAQRRDTGRTVLVAMRALGPNGAEGANILALGDVVRA